MSLTFARLRLCRICILKVTRERFLVKTAALKAAAGVPTDDLTLAALISAAQCSSQQQIMESGNGGGGGGGADGQARKSSDAL